MALVPRITPMAPAVHQQHSDDVGGILQTGEDIPTLSGADSDEVQQAFNEAVNLDRLLGCLLVDCPQDLFWI